MQKVDRELRKLERHAKADWEDAMYDERFGRSDAVRRVYWATLDARQRVNKREEVTMKRFAVVALLFAVATGCATSLTGRSQLMLISPEAAIVESKKAYLSTVS